jgi:hypothetical protein
LSKIKESVDSLGGWIVMLARRLDRKLKLSSVMSKFAKGITTAAAFVALTLPLVNCASKGSSPTPATAQSSTANPLDAAGLTTLVSGFYHNILGRLPTAAELENGIALLQSGMTNQQLQQALAGGAESIWNITQHLLANGVSGANLQTIVTSWITQLSQGATLQQLLATL